MFLDGTAIAAILLGDAEGDYLLGRLESHKGDVHTSPLGVIEAVDLITKSIGQRQHALCVVQEFLQAVKCKQIAITPILGEKAIGVMEVFGIGHIEAFSYVCVKTYRLDLLAVAERLEQTDHRA